MAKKMTGMETFKKAFQPKKAKKHKGQMLVPNENVTEGSAYKKTAKKHKVMCKKMHKHSAMCK